MFSERQGILIIWINEPKTSKLDCELMKKFCEGLIKGKLLYEDGTHNFPHNGLPIFTCQVIPF